MIRKTSLVAVLFMLMGILVPAVVVAQEEAPPMRVQIVEQENPDFKNRVAFNPLGLLVGIGNFIYERELSPSFALEIAPSFIYFGFGDSAIYGGSLGLGASWYISGNAPEGLRLNAGVMPGYVGSSEASEGVFLFGARVMFGYNWIWRNGFSLGLHGGVQYLHFSLEGVSTSLNGILPAVDFNLGFAF